MIKSKKSVRAHYKKIRDSLSGARRFKAARELALRAPYHQASLVLSFASIQSEIDTTPLNQALVHAGKLVLPALCDGALHLYHVGSLEDLAEGEFGIPTPDPNASTPVSLDAIDLALVPGLAFDKRGHRTGYGKGHYDQLLKEARNLSTIGICFKEQLADLLPEDPWDIPVDDVLAV